MPCARRPKLCIRWYRPALTPARPCEPARRPATAGLPGADCMLGLTLREEFRGRRLKGTAIELANETKTGATQVAAADFLRITYPTTDLLTALEAVGRGHDRPVVLLGDRGQGKSHLLAALHHAFTDPTATRRWLAEWAQRLGNPKLAALPLRDPPFVITESLSRQNYKFLWDILFERHPHGAYIRGKWEAQGDKRTDIPGDKLIVELIEHTPMALILDEFQTWYDGLTNTKQYPWRQWAFNFIQILSEVATRHPDRLVFVASVRSGESDAYLQLHRIDLTRIDFKGPNARRDRLRLLLHRLFENRMHVPDDKIVAAIDAHVAEYLRLMDVAPADHDKVRRDFAEAWPFAPHLMTLLEDQVLIATQAQETRDLIRILADIFKHHDKASPIITAADFRLENEHSGIAALLDSVANQHHATLRERAQNNVRAVLDAVKRADVPNLEPIVGSLWLRSLALQAAGAESAELQVDITRTQTLDDNGFAAELALIAENSFNIHQDGRRYVFRNEENPQAKLMASARNDKQFADGSDRIQLAKLVRYTLTNSDEATTKVSRVIVLPMQWEDDPWSHLEPQDQPDRWDSFIPLLVLPEPTTEAALGKFTRKHLQKRRNAVRFLLPRDGTEDIFRDRTLLVVARAVMLASQWRVQNKEYSRLYDKCSRELRDTLQKRFDRFAILDTWNYQQPERCRFHFIPHRAEGAKIPEAVDRFIENDLFIEEDFVPVVQAAAQQGDSLAALLAELQEPRTNGEACLPWLGETRTIDRVYVLCARGDIALNRGGLTLLQRQPGEDEALALQRIHRTGTPTGRQLSDTTLSVPQPVAHSGEVTASPPGPAGQLNFTANHSNTPARPPAPTDPAGPASSVPTNIFSASPTTTLRPCASHSTSALNLLGKVESWGITTGSQVHDVALKVGHLTGAQLNELLRKLPDGLTYELTLQKEET